MVKNTTAASRPWNLSTVPTGTPRVRASASSVSRSSATWSLYGATTMKSSTVNGLVTPCWFTHGVPSSRRISPATSCASSTDSVEQPSWSARSHRSPVPNSVLCRAQSGWLSSRPS